MTSKELPIRILLVRSWLHRLEPIRTALRAAGFSPSFVRVDIEPALHAALTRGGFDVVIIDSTLRRITREVVRARIGELRPGTPLVVLGSLHDLGARIAAVLEARRN